MEGLDNDLKRKLEDYDAKLTVLGGDADVGEEGPTPEGDSPAPRRLRGVQL